ncbi:E2F-associated phosphoprotein [Arapaima gigas]
MEKKDYDSYEIEEPSDEERAASSSEDELEILLHGNPSQKRKLIREYLTGESESSSGDEFEKEMEAELSSTMKTIECGWGVPTTSGTSSTTDSNATDTSGLQPQFYDSVYFDSDSDEEMSSNSAARRAKQRRIPTNDELLFDPDEDDRDQAWVDAKRKAYRSGSTRLQKAAERKGKPRCVPSSDAVLNCPACMTTLCLDCQRHEKYHTQYRAMFVMNCTVNKEEVLRYRAPDKRKTQSKKRKSYHGTSSGAAGSKDVASEEEEKYHPVQCAECCTEVAVFDKDEVYHFFNILASHS